MKNEVMCNTCNVMFAIDHIITVDIGDNKEELYFECPACKHRYDICVRPKSIKLPLVSQSV